jgi:hypothetical protein
MCEISCHHSSSIAWIIQDKFYAGIFYQQSRLKINMVSEMLTGRSDEKDVQSFQGGTGGGGLDGG